MIGTKETNLLQQLHQYVDEYLAYIGDKSSIVTPQVNEDLRRIIHDLEALQKQPEPRQHADQVSEGICDQLERLRQQNQREHVRRRLRGPQRTLAQSFQDYIESEVNYLVGVGSHPNREQINLLLSDAIADLKALALHPTDEQAEQLAADLERKREQITKLERPWQQRHT